MNAPANIAAMRAAPSHALFDDVTHPLFTASRRELADAAMAIFGPRRSGWSAADRDARARALTDEKLGRAAWFRAEQAKRGTL